MKLPELKQNLKFTMLSLTCVSGLVSCYPVTPALPSNVAPKIEEKPSGVKSAEELKLAKAKREAAAKKTSLQKSKERLEREEKARIAAERKEAAAYRDQVTPSLPNSGSSSSSSSSVTSSTPKITPTPTPSAPVSPSVKFAAPVPNKAGFVYNPFTHNQVDVRGIPSGTKVRDPHDSNPAHIFKVP